MYGCLTIPCTQRRVVPKASDRLRQRFDQHNAERFGAQQCSDGGFGDMSQSPSLRGSGRFAYLDEPPGWRLVFQSPSLRGSGRFSGSPPRQKNQVSMFQSPSLRGSGRFARARPGEA